MIVRENSSVSNTTFHDYTFTLDYKTCYKKGS